MCDEKYCRVSEEQATVMVKNPKYEEYFLTLNDALKFINTHCKGYWTQIYRKVGDKWVLAGSEAKIRWYKQ